VLHRVGPVRVPHCGAIIVPELTKDAFLIIADPSLAYHNYLLIPSCTPS